MAENDREILSCARKIKNYCNGRLCEKCVFCRCSKVGYTFCVLTDDDGNPCDWVIPRKIGGEDGRE